MSQHVHIVIESGEDKGKEIVVPAQGARMGRSSRNDVTLNDPLLSRHHCRVFFKENEGMWVADLGSANKTYVNGQAVEEIRIRVGDSIVLGDTVMKVVRDSLDPPPAGGAPAASAAPAPAVDLGLGAPPAPLATPKKNMRERLILLLIALVAFTATILVWKHVGKETVGPDPTTGQPVEQLPRTLEIVYEKVDATPKNIFRYELTLARDGMLVVRVDDIMNERRLVEETRLDERKIAGLIRDFHGAPFFALNEEHVGFQPNTLTQWDLSLTLDNRTHRVLVRNRPEPDAFKAVRERIEVFGKTELGLWAMQFPREQLVQMAEDAYERARRLYQEREVRHENLHAAIVSLRRAHADLRSVEPKPDFFPDSLTLLSDCVKLLDEKHTALNFQASRAINLEQWEEASDLLRAILDTIPDESDSRYREARQKLLETDNRLRARR